jgi:hypothetical protein
MKLIASLHFGYGEDIDISTLTLGKFKLSHQRLSTAGEAIKVDV